MNADKHRLKRERNIRVHPCLSVVRNKYAYYRDLLLSFPKEGTTDERK
jgi:hypothetical protein